LFEPVVIRVIIVECVQRYGAKRAASFPYPLGMLCIFPSSRLSQGFWGPSSGFLCKGRV